MNVIDSDLTEALSALAAKCPGASVHVSAHHVPCETFAADDVKKVHVVNSGGRTWLAGTAEYHAGDFEYRIEFYSVDLPQAPATENDADAEVIAL